MNNPMDLSRQGITLIESVGNWVRGVGLRTGFVPLSWDHDARPGLVWRVPDPQIPGASIFSRVQGVLVRDFEQAIVLHNGSFHARLTAGVYDLQKMPIKDLMEVIWVSTQQTQHKWGAGKVINVENISLGAHGYVFLQVEDAQKFVLEVVAGNRRYSQQDLEDWVFSIVSSVMRTQIAATPIRTLMQSQEEFVRACRNRLGEAFARWGLAFKDLVVSQFDIPQEYRDAISAVTLAKFESEKTVTNAEAEAEALRIRSRAEAEARLTTGGAEVQLLAKMQSMGLDPVRLKAIESLTQYAQLAARTGGGDDGGSDMIKMMMFMQMSRLLTDPGMPGEAKAMLRAQFPQETAQMAQLPEPPTSSPADSLLPQLAPAPTTADGDENSPERIQAILDKLDERLANGEISEGTYDRLRAKWEKKLEEAGGRP